MTTGFLLVTNNVESAQEAQFNAWYQEEHLDERLSVPGFLWARRYVALEAAQRYAALYETSSPEVLLSPTYASLLGAPTARTHAIMPHFRDMTRVIARVAFKREVSVGGTAAILFMSVNEVSDAQARHVGELALQSLGHARRPEAVRVLLAQPDRIGVDTPESRLRPGGDRSAALTLIVEWLQADGKDVRRLRQSLTAAGVPVETQRGGLYRLLCVRQTER